MRIALCSTVVPFIDGGARQIVEWLETHLLEAGHDVERVYLPEVDAPGLLYRQMMAFRWVDLSDADLVICLRPQSHLISHPNKVLWFIHHVRVFYDLWDSPYRDFPDDDKHRGIRSAIHAADSAAIAEARAVFTNSRVVSDRLKQFNRIDSEVLYPPIFRPERFTCRGYNDEIVYISRIEHHKRQHLLVEALAQTTTPVRLRLCGTTGGAYAKEVRDIAERLGVADRLSFDNRWITEDDKAKILSECLASAYLPVNEDSYGYPTLEAAHSAKPVLTTTDSGGVLEFVQNGRSGLVSAPDPASLAAGMDALFADREATARMGEAAASRIHELGVSWPRVIERLLA